MEPLIPSLLFVSAIATFAAGVAAALVVAAAGTLRHVVPARPARPARPAVAPGRPLEPQVPVTART